MVSAGTHIKCAAGTLRAYLRRRTDDALASFVSSRSLSVRGSWGAAPSVFWFLLYAQKERPGGEPYRLCTLHILRDAFRRPQTIPCRVGIQILISKKPRPAARRLPTWSKISSAAHSSANRSPAPARRDPSPPQNIIINPSKLSPNKSTSYINLTHQSPIL